MALGDKRVDPKTGEPEIEIAGGAWVTDWEALKADSLASGDAVERVVFQRNRGQAMGFGDLEFRVPSSGNSSLQFRVGSGSTTINNFTTHWSNQQGGASENAFNFTIGTSWAYFRANGALNLTQHNSYQEATFQNNGWVYNVQVIVGLSWLNNRFSFSRWRLAGVKGDAGTNGTNGVDGLDGVGLATDTTETGTPLNGGSTREYVLQWNGTQIVNTLAKEKWTSGSQEYVVDHLTRYMMVIGLANITSSGTIGWAQAFADTGYTFAHDLREAQAETASLRINTRGTSSITFTLFDSTGTGDSGSQVHYTIIGRI